MTCLAFCVLNKFKELAWYETILDQFSSVVNKIQGILEMWYSNRVTSWILEFMSFKWKRIVLAWKFPRNFLEFYDTCCRKASSKSRANSVEDTQCYSNNFGMMGTNSIDSRWPRKNIPEQLVRGVDWVCSRLQLKSIHHNQRGLFNNSAAARTTIL